MSSGMGAASGALSALAKQPAFVDPNAPQQGQISFQAPQQQPAQIKYAPGSLQDILQRVGNGLGKVGG